MKAATRSLFGQFEGHDVMQTTLSNSAGMRVDVIDYGAIVQRVLLPTAHGSQVDVVLGFDDLPGYLACDTFFGAIVGRVANRIAEGRFELSGKSYQLAANDTPHHLHGGPRGFDRVCWSSEAGTSDDAAWVKLSYRAAAGEEGYPGELLASVTYSLTDRNELQVDMSATTKEETLVNLAHHGYWNLAGHDAGNLDGTTIVVHADAYTPGTPVVPDGRVAPVEGTPFDLRKPTPLTQLDQIPGTPPGFDENFVVRGDATAYRSVCELHHAASGRRLIVSADQPGAQIYTGNFLDGSLGGKEGASYGRHSAICVETQSFPNAINVPAWREQVILRPGDAYHHRMTHSFTL